MEEKILKILIDMQKDIKDLKQDVQVLKQEMKEVKEDIQVLKQEIEEVKENQRIMKNNIAKILEEQIKTKEVFQKHEKEANVRYKEIDYRLAVLES